MSNPVLFDDIFEIRDINPEKKVFDKVSRIVCSKSENYELEMTVDINTDIYPLEPSRKDDSLADSYEYVMYGRVFKYADEKGPASRVVVLVSFGGLLMELKGEPRFLQGIELDSIVYLLVRKA